MGVGVQRKALAALTPGAGLVSHFRGGWIVPSVRWDGNGE